MGDVWWTSERDHKNMVHFDFAWRCSGLLRTQIQYTVLCNSSVWDWRRQNIHESKVQSSFSFFFVCCCLWPFLFLHSTLEHIQETAQMLRVKSINISAVIYGGFIWDLKHQHERYCYSIRNEEITDAIVSAACSMIFSRIKKNIPLQESESKKLDPNFFPSLIPDKAFSPTNDTQQFRNYIDAVEAWNNLALPWCTPEIFEDWKKGTFF